MAPILRIFFSCLFKLLLLVLKIRNDEIFKRRLDRYKYHIRYPERPFEEYRRDVSEFLNEYNVHLDSGSYMFGEAICFCKFQNVI